MMETTGLARKLLLFVPVLLVGCAEAAESPTPTLQGASPGLVCNDQLTTEVSLVGTGLSPVINDGLAESITLLLPDISLTRSTGLDGGASEAATVDLDETQAQVRWRSQSEMLFDISPELGVDPGVYDISVSNYDGGTATLPAGLAVVPPPRVDTVDPDVICTEQFTNDVTLIGEFFISVGDEVPTVSVGDQTYPVESMTDCFDLAGPVVAQSCTTVSVSIPMQTLGVGEHELLITNPSPAACASTEIVILTVVPPPTVASVNPTTVCSTGGRFSVLGSDFRDGAEVLVGETPATEVTFVDDTELEVLFSGGPTQGVEDVTVVNADGCSDTLPAAIEVVPGPVLFFVDPPVAYSGIATQATLLVSGISGAIVSVWMRLSQSDDIVDLDFTYDPADPNRIVAVIPSGLPPGDYTVFVQEDTACVPFLENAVTIEDTLTLALDSVAPSFGWTEAFTAVDIRTQDPAPDGQVQFEDLPRVYLNPPDPDTDDSAVAFNLSSVALQDATTLTAIVPAGLEVGVYDVIVVNPTGEIGLLRDIFAVTEDPPPVIDSVAPTRLSASDATDITVQGDNFRDVQLSLDCRTSDGAPTSGTVTTDSSTANTAQGRVNSDSIPEGTVCVVRVTNRVDGSFFDYSAISIGSPSGNLFGFRDSSTLNTARRAPAATAGRATNTARFLYAIGGDDGSSAGAMTSIEVAPLDVFGELGDWRTLPNQLPQARTLAAVATVGDFIYLVGGNDGSGPVDSILRAQILDPLEAPLFERLSIAITDAGTGVSGGTWSYRISATFPADDPSNPNGESLPSDPVVVRLPEIDESIELTLAWNAVPDADGYLVYRIPEADVGSNREQLLATVDGGDNLTYTDAGDVGVIENRPLRIGALGQWHPTDDLVEASEGPCVALGTDPDDSDLRYLYVAGGRDTDGDVLDVVDALPIDDSSGRQSFGMLFDAGVTLADARWQCGGFTVDEANHSLPASGDSWVVFGPGRTGPSNTTIQMDGGLVGEDGSLTDWSGFDGPTPGRAGYGAVSASDFLYIFGGRQGSANSGGQEGEVQALPDDIDWDALGGSGINTERVLMGSAQESAVFFVVGGTSGNGALSTTETASY